MDIEKERVREKLVEYIRNTYIPTIEEFCVENNLLSDILHNECFYTELSLLKSKAITGLRKQVSNGDITQPYYKVRIQELEDSFRQHKQLQDEKTKSSTKKYDLYNELQRAKLDLLTHGLVTRDLAASAYFGFADVLAKDMLDIGTTELLKWSRLIEEGRKTKTSSLEVAKFILEEINIYTVTKIKLNKKHQKAALAKKVTQFYKEHKLDEVDITQERNQVTVKNTEKKKFKSSRDRKVDKVDRL